MEEYFLLSDGTITDGCGCYDNNNHCYCSDCFYYGEGGMGCTTPDLLRKEGGGRPVEWDAVKKKWVLKETH